MKLHKGDLVKANPNCKYFDTKFGSLLVLTDCRDRDLVIGHVIDPLEFLFKWETPVSSIERLGKKYHTFEVIEHNYYREEK